jgi:hypothetical protein
VRCEETLTHFSYGFIRFALKNGFDDIYMKAYSKHPSTSDPSDLLTYKGTLRYLDQKVSHRLKLESSRFDSAFRTIAFCCKAVLSGFCMA